MLYEQIMSGEDAAAAAQLVRHLVTSQHIVVMDRGGFATLGASAYLDDPNAYVRLASVLNPKLSLLFGSLISYTTERAADLLGLDREHAKQLPGKAIPGFHFFGPLSNGMQGSIHTDEPQMRCEWPSPVKETYSFTLALELPTNGGGLDIWDAGVSDPEVSSNGNFKYHPYIPGVLYAHAGDRYHRIASTGRLHVEDARITLQGHFAVLADKRVVPYF